MTEYPEHDKLSKVKEDSQKLGEFLDWLTEDGIVLCRWEEREEFYNSRYYMDTESIEHRLARYFGIDLNKLEEEKRDMLQRMRDAQK